MTYSADRARSSSQAELARRPLLRGPWEGGLVIVRGGVRGREREMRMEELMGGLLRGDGKMKEGEENQDSWEGRKKG